MPFKEESSEYTNNVHFTYKSNPDMHSLCQGDVLYPTEELIEVLREVHPYFLNEQYKYFMVLTQSCDLVRRNGKNCKTPYITLAAVRSYSDFLKRVLTKGKYAEENKGLLLMDDKNKDRAFQLVERVYNNTEPEYFFLYKEETLDLQESMVAYLKVSIALKSKEHYDKCLRAKKIELTDEFKAKVGWLVGNMYSRVGTADWDGIMAAQTRRNMLYNDLSSTCVIGSKDQLNQLKRMLQEKGETVLNHEDAISFISDIQVESKYDKVMKIIEEAIQTSGRKIKEEEKDRIIKSIRSRSVLKTLIT